MTAATIALTAAEAEAIARAGAALSRVRADTFPWEVARSDEIKACAENLREALDDYADLTASPPRTHPATLFPDLAYGQDNAMELALDMVTEDIGKLTGDLDAMANQAEEAARLREEAMAA